MKHIDDMKLIKFVAGDLNAADSKAATDHFAECEQCADRKIELIKTWNDLGEWDIEYDKNVNLNNISLKVITAARKIRRVGGTYYFRTILLPATLRYAASILIAIGVGALLGRQSVSGKHDLSAVDKQPEYLAALSMQWSSDLTWSILEDDLPADEEAQ